VVCCWWGRVFCYSVIISIGGGMGISLPKHTHLRTRFVHLVE